MRTKQRITGFFMAVVVAVTALTVPAAAAKLDSPENTKVTAKTTTSISIQWDKVEGAAKYCVYYSADKKKDYKEYGTTSKTKATVKGLKDNTKYWLYVRAVDKKGNKSSYSKVVSAFTEKKAEAVESTETKSTGKLKITQAAGTVANNSIATVKAVGKPNTVYELSVYYSTQQSKAKGTGKATSDASGAVCWSWKVGTNTKEGSHRIVIEGGGETLETSFTTVK